eukprot:c43798_g1_i1 orf=239-541(-)
MCPFLRVQKRKLLRRHHHRHHDQLVKKQESESIPTPLLPRPRIPPKDPYMPSSSPTHQRSLPEAANQPTLSTHHSLLVAHNRGDSRRSHTPSILCCGMKT